MIKFYYQLFLPSTKSEGLVLREKGVPTSISLMEEAGLWAGVALSELKAKLRLEPMPLKFFYEIVFLDPMAGRLVRSANDSLWVKCDLPLVFVWPAS